LPLCAAILAGLAGKWIGRTGSHVVTIAAVGASFVLSAQIAWQLITGEVSVYNDTVYTWLVSDGIRMEVGFLVDQLSVLMMCVVTFVSLCVHIYTIGYMHEDPGYQRFFSYISLFTFAMLMLVMSNNFLQLFFGWEAVGVVSYLLIGFWYTKPSAIFANMKAFLVNRVGDFGFVLGIAGVVYYTGSLDYRDAFAAAPAIATAQFALGDTWTVSAITLICICLFIGAMGKSAQVPLHVWLPDSMEGPTPISALIHAATMVTAGIFMVARFSPLFEQSEAALSFVLVVGATTALFMGFLGIVNNDIKRVVAYSTLSQLGYMTVALGASAYGAAIFHLMTHAFFKALLFLAAGSVIIGMHHEQDMRKMGGLARLMPITAITCWIGALALIGTPFLSGFYSKDFIIEAVHESDRWGAGYAYWCVLIGVFVTAFYTFRMIFMTFHGAPRWAHDDHAHDDHAHDDHGHHGHGGTPHESPWVVTLPLVLLAIPSIVIGYLTVQPVLFGGYFAGAIVVLERNDVLAELATHFHDPASFALAAVGHPPLWLALAGVLSAWYLFLKNPAAAARLAGVFAPVRKLLDNKYYFDWFNENVLAAGSRLLGRVFWKAGDQTLIDGALVNGSANLIGALSGVVRRIQTGYLYSYAFWMMIGLAGLLAWFLVFA
jgi:NADH-quinone oxidoreductase subunit L